MTIFLTAPGIEHRLKEINETLKNIQAIMADDFSSEDAKVIKATSDISEAKTRIPHPEQETKQGE